MQKPQVPPVPYLGDPVDDLRVLRGRCFRELGEAFPMVKIDDSGSTAITLVRSASLLCNVDVVAANWFDTNDFARSGAEVDRGVCVLNRDTSERPENYPFRFNQRIADHDRNWSGVPRMIIRLLKTIKADLRKRRATPSIFPASTFARSFIVYRILLARMDSPRRWSCCAWNWRRCFRWRRARQREAG